jgi:hypothetical protein
MTYDMTPRARAERANTYLQACEQKAYRKNAEILFALKATAALTFTLAFIFAIAKRMQTLAEAGVNPW